MRGVCVIAGRGDIPVAQLLMFAARDARPTLHRRQECRRSQLFSQLFAEATR